MRWQLHFNDANMASLARHAFVDFLHLVCEPESDFSSAELIFGELLANVIRHAPGPVSITVNVAFNGVVALEVLDTGNGFQLDAEQPPMDNESGRGMYIALQLCPRVYTKRVVDGHVVTAVLPVNVADRFVSRALETLRL